MKNKACCVLLLRIPGPHLGAITALNFSTEHVKEHITFEPLLEPNGQNQTAGAASDILNGEQCPTSQGGLAIDLAGHS